MRKNRVPTPRQESCSKVKGLTPEDVMRFKAAQILAYTPVSQLRNLEKQNVLKGPEAALKAGIKELEKYIGPTDPGSHYSLPISG